MTGDTALLYVIQECKVTKQARVWPLNDFEVLLLAVDHLKPQITKKLQILYNQVAINA
jgi:hypothetical protein